MCRVDKQLDATFLAAGHIADRLLVQLNEPEIRPLLAAANMPKASSSQIQEVFLAFATELGFKDEFRGLFADYETRGLRPGIYRDFGTNFAQEARGSPSAARVGESRSSCGKGLHIAVDRKRPALVRG